MIVKPIQAIEIGSLRQLFLDLDQDANFTPHSFGSAEADRLRNYVGRDLYRVVEAADANLVAYGMLRGWDEGFPVPSLGIAVRVAYRGRGIGRFLLEELHALAKDAGALQVRLRVNPNNLPAISLYARFCYKAVGEERGQMVMLCDL